MRNADTNALAVQVQQQCSILTLCMMLAQHTATVSYTNTVTITMACKMLFDVVTNLWSQIPQQQVVLCATSA
jgi:hypothetical protein